MAPATRRYLDLEIDGPAREGRLGLTRAEFDLLLALTEVPGVAWTRDRLADRGFGEAYDAFDRTADRERLGQAIAALVDNAIRFAPSGGHVLIRGIVSPRSASLARVEVLDDGPGVPADDMAHVFDRFYQADPSRDRGSGTSGLGLAITRAIVEAHGGSAGVENPAEGGARFWIDLPLVRPV